MTRGFLDEDDERRRDREGESPEPVEFDDVYAERETGLALLCVIKLAGRLQERWIPKSQIHDDSEVYRAGHRGKLVITDWFAQKEGLEP